MIRQTIRFSLALAVLSAGSFGLSGCGDSGSTTSGTAPEVKVEPPVNPAPGALQPESNKEVPAK